MHGEWGGWVCTGKNQINCVSVEAFFYFFSRKLHLLKDSHQVPHLRQAWSLKFADIIPKMVIQLLPLG